MSSTDAISLDQHTLAKLRDIFSTPPHLVDHTAATSLVRLLSRHDSHVCRQVAASLITLYGDNSMSSWLRSLYYEELLRDSLMNNLCLIFYNIPHAVVIRNDIRELKSYTKVYRYPIPSYLISKFKLFKQGLGPAPYPPRSWSRSLRL